jgi:phytoene desaturase (3,4-didehydrolycopene-forming)
MRTYINPMRAQMSQICAHPHAILSQELYVGLSPYNAPGVFSLLAATELTDGVWYPKGGFGKIRDALESIVTAKLGVALRTNAGVAEILLEDTEAGGKKAVRACACMRLCAARRVLTHARPALTQTGVRLVSGEVVSADIVVANPDIPYVFGSLLPSGGPAYESEAKRLDGMDYSASVVAFNWALSAPLPGLLHHNVFLSSDFKGSWERPTCPADMAAPRQLNFYVHNPVYTDASTAPPGGSSIMVLLPMGNLQEQAKAAKGGGVPDANAMIDAARDAVLRRFAADGHGDLKALMLSETVIAPAAWRDRYNIAHGAVFGLSHGLTQLACFRPPTRTGLPGWPETPTPEGLYFVGASTRPGNGVPLVMMGVKVVYENIMRDVAARAAPQA